MRTISVPNISNKTYWYKGHKKKYKDENFTPPDIIWTRYISSDEAETLGPESRNTFVLTVFVLVIVMLMITAGFAASFHLVRPMRKFLRRNVSTLSIPAAIVFVLTSCLISFVSAAKRGCFSWTLLLLLALSAGILCASATIYTRTVVVYGALAALGLLVIVCNCLALSPFDFTKYYLYIVVAVVASASLLIVFCIISLVFKINLKPLHIATLVISAIALMFCLAMEIQMILGGKTIELSVDEYVAAACMTVTYTLAFNLILASNKHLLK